MRPSSEVQVHGQHFKLDTLLPRHFLRRKPDDGADGWNTEETTHQDENHQSPILLDCCGQCGSCIKANCSAGTTVVGARGEASTTTPGGCAPGTWEWGCQHEESGGQPVAVAGLRFVAELHIPAEVGWGADGGVDAGGGPCRQGGQTAAQSTLSIRGAVDRSTPLGGGGTRGVLSSTCAGRGAAFYLEERSSTLGGHVERYL